MRRLLVLAITLVCATSAAANPLVVAHRGGALAEGQPIEPENSLPAFENAARHGWVLEFDVHLTKDGVPVVIHDDTLDRVSNCSGLVKDRTAADLRASCWLDHLGRPEEGPAADNPQHTPIPTLDEVLDLAKRHRATISPEIKNLPPTSQAALTANDFDPDPRGFAAKVSQALAASGYPQDRIIVQSFWPANLEVARQYLPDAHLSLLTLGQMNDAAPEFAKGARYDWVSPEFGSGLHPSYVQRAHAHGEQVTVYTPNSDADIAEAVAEGADAIISDDPARVERIVARDGPARPAIPAAPGDDACAAVRAHRSLPTVTAFTSQDAGRSIRVFAMQFKQDLHNVVSYQAFRTKIECAIRERVLPYRSATEPNVVSFNEDVGLMTLGTGTRGAVARALFDDPHPKLSCEPQGVPCGTVAALGAVTAGYGPQVAAYRARFPGGMEPVAGAFVASVDTQARGWMQVFSDMARRYGVYIAGSSDLPPFRESTDPAEIATFADPDLGALPKSVFVATSPHAYNTAFVWGPQDVRADGPAPLRNVVLTNEKVPLTPIEQEIELAPGPATGLAARWNLEPFAIPGSDARIGIATSLPAFVYGDAATPDPCADVSVTYMRCLDALGANVVLQDEANPGRWANDGTPWQPEEWMDSTSRAVTDPTVGFAYNVTPMMVGNLADLAFDGQTAITRRAPLSGPGCHYVGVTHADGRFLALLPWVTADGPRASLVATGAKLAPGSGDPLENDYAEGAIAADLDFGQGMRPGCAGS